MDDILQTILTVKISYKEGPWRVTYNNVVIYIIKCIYKSNKLSKEQRAYKPIHEGVNYSEKIPYTF